MPTGISEKKGRRIWSKRVTWVLLHAAHFFQTYREVGELEIALSFALLQMSLGHWSWKYLTGDLPRPAQPFREGHDAPPGRRPFFGRSIFSNFFFCGRISDVVGEREQSFGPLSLSCS